MKWILLTMLPMAPALFAQAEMDVLRAGVTVADGGTDEVSNTGTSPFNLTYTIENTGSANLTLSGTPAVAISNEDNCTVNVLSQPATPVAAGGGSTTFVIQVSPISATGFSFDISIDNNDADENPYNFLLDGSTQSSGGSSSGGNPGGDDCSTSESTTAHWVMLAICALLALCVRPIRIRPTGRGQSHGFN